MSEWRVIIIPRELESYKQLGLGSSIVIAAFSTIVEWYDFTLYLYFATVLSRVFFGGGEGALIVTLAGFAVAYLLRPLGAVYSVTSGTSSAVAA